VNFIDIPRNVHINSMYTFIERCAESKFYFPGESHPFWEMVYVVDGSVGVTADERIYTLSAGDMIFHKPMEFHRIWSQEGTEPNYVVVSFTADGEYMKKLENRAVSCDEYSRELMKKAVELRLEAFSVKNGFLVDYIHDEEKAFLCTKLLEMLFCHTALSGEIIGVTEDKDALLFGKAVALLQESIGEKVSVEQIASRCFVSASKIKKVFSKYVGCGISEYFTYMKITSARLMLQRGQTVSTVSESLGFSNQFYFSSVFKKITGITPSKYKKNASEK